MANNVKLKRSSVPSKVPATTDLQLGELAINTYDGKLFLKKDDGTESIVQIGGGGGTGDVTSSSTTSTDNSLARFDGTTGKVIQNSVATLSDTGNLDTTSAKVDYLDLDTTASAPANQAGRIYWDAGNGTPSIDLSGDVSLQLGQEIITLVYNGSGSTIPNGSVVAVTGAQGQRPSVVLADADTEALSASTLGIATQDIANGTEGYITSFGFVRGIDTSAFTAGAPIYLSQTAGQFTATRPNAPAHTVFLGWVIKVNSSSGEVFVHISNGWELGELHDVLITSPTGGNLLSYDATNQYWKNVNLTDGTGISITETTGGAITITNSDLGSSQAIFKNIAVSGQSNIVADSNNDTLTVVAGTGISITTNATTDALTITNSAPDKTVAITGTSPVSVTGTYPNFTASLSSGYGDTQNPYASKTANFFLAAPNGTAGVPTFRAIVAADIPTLNQNTTGTASNVTGTVAIANGGTGSTTAAGARTNLGATTLGANVFTITNPSAITFPRFNANNTVSALSAADMLTALGGTTVGQNFFDLTNPSAITFPRINADNTVSALSAADFRTAIGAGAGTVTSVSGTGTVAGLTLSGTVTSSGNITLGGNLSITADMIYDNFTANGTQTSFTTSQTYTSGKIEVYCNGVKMRNGDDVTVTSETAVVFATAPANTSLIDLVYPI